jgi:hypothetical protein
MPQPALRDIWPGKTASRPKWNSGFHAAALNLDSPIRLGYTRTYAHREHVSVTGSRHVDKDFCLSLHASSEELGSRI